MLNLVAVTTLRFLGSTAPTATSGVSTTAINFGGAVNTAALPNLTENPDPKPDTGVPVLGDGLTDALLVLRPEEAGGVIIIIPGPMFSESRLLVEAAS